MHSITQTTVEVKVTVHYQSNETLDLLDHTLAQANHYKAQWLATGEVQWYRLWQGCQQDRAALLGLAGEVE